jgi:hypothetical protein
VDNPDHNNCGLTYGVWDNVGHTRDNKLSGPQNASNPALHWIFTKTLDGMYNLFDEITRGTRIVLSNKIND